MPAAITQLQSQKIRHFFKVLDNNGNRILQPDDFKDVARKICQAVDLDPASSEYELTMVQSYRMFIQIMTDLGKEEDLEITMDEFEQFFENNLVSISVDNPAPIQGYITRSVNYIFNLFDRNKDGFISIDEYVKMFEIYGIDTSYSITSFQKLDLNSDEVITKEELVKAFAEYFLSTDPNSPGNWIFGKWDS